MTTRGLAGLAVAIALLAGCTELHDDAAPAPVGAPSASATLQAAEIRIGDRPTIDIRITTAPERSVLPPELPAALTGIEIVEWQTRPVVRGPRSWIHSQTVTLRAREIGRFEWPALQLTVASPDGAHELLELPAIPLPVGSIRAEHPGRSAPYGARAAPPRAQPRGSAPFALAAAGFSIALAAAVLLVFARRRGRDTGTPLASAPPAWSEARSELERAAELAHDPAVASHHAAAALRRYVDRRFGARTRTLTTEELAVCDPPYGATSRWPELVALLRALDELRFRPAALEPGDCLRSAFTAALASAHEFVETTIPPEGLR